MYKNGITEQHLKDNYDLGMQAGRREAIYSCYAAAALALHDELGFGGKRIMRIIRRLDEHVCNTLSSKEAIDDVNERFGLHITFADPFGYMVEA